MDLSATGLSVAGISCVERRTKVWRDTPVRNGQAVVRSGSRWTSDESAVIGSLIVVGFCLLTGLCFGSAALKPFEMVPWLVSLGFVGLPHGAADLAVLRARLGGKSTARFFAVYTLGLAAMTVLLVVCPQVAMALFLLFSLWHFGHADTTAPGTVDFWGPAVARSLFRSGMILGCPLAFWSESVCALVSDASRLLAPVRMLFGLPGLLAHPVTIGQVQVIGLMILALSGLAGLICFVFFCLYANPGGSRRGAYLNGMAWMLVAGMSLVAPPLLSVGVMFLVWHAGQQIPLIAVQLGAGKSAPLVQQLLVVHRAALPLLIPVWLALGLAWYWLSAAHSLYDLTLLSILMYLVVTPSHELLCVWQEWTHSARPGQAAGATMVGCSSEATG